MIMLKTGSRMSADPISRSTALVVDDDPPSLLMVSDALEEAGITVMAARNGESALRLAARLKPVEDAQ